MKMICVSGGFDPIHPGHIQLIENAADYGKVLVLVNTDDWLIRKKGYFFQTIADRIKIVNSLRSVTWAVAAIDDDDTVVESLKSFRPDYFANGGDRGKTNTPEAVVCKEYGIEVLYGIGGDYKYSSSSTLVESAAKQL